MGANYESAARLLRTGPSRPTLYEVEVPFGSFLGGSTHNRSEEHLRLFCTSVTIPGITHDVLDTAGFVHNGIIRSVPKGVNYGNNNPLDLEIIENSDWTVYNSLKTMFDRTTVGEASNSPDGPRTIRMGYYDDNLFTINLYKIEFPDGGLDLSVDGSYYREGYKHVCRFTFYNCYMTTLRNIQLDSTAIDTALKVRCGFNYESYHYTRL